MPRLENKNSSEELMASAVAKAYMGRKFVFLTLHYIHGGLEAMPPVGSRGKALVGSQRAQPPLEADNISTLLTQLCALNNHTVWHLDNYNYVVIKRGNKGDL